MIGYGIISHVYLFIQVQVDKDISQIGQEKYVHTVLKPGHNTAKLFCLQSIISVTIRNCHVLKHVIQKRRLVKIHVTLVKIQPKLFIKKHL